MAPKSRRRKRKSSPDWPVEYIVAITGWDYSYSFGTNYGAKDYDEPYSDRASLTLTGELKKPEGFQYHRVKIDIYSEDRVRKGMGNEPPKLVGILIGHHEDLDAAVFMPTRRITELSALAQSGRLAIAAITGTKLRYRKANITHITIDTNAASEDYM